MSIAGIGTTYFFQVEFAAFAAYPKYTAFKFFSSQVDTDTY